MLQLVNLLGMEPLSSHLKLAPLDDEDKSFPLLASTASSGFLATWAISLLNKVKAMHKNNMSLKEMTLQELASAFAFEMPLNRVQRELKWHFAIHQVRLIPRHESSHIHLFVS